MTQRQRRFPSVKDENVPCISKGLTSKQLRAVFWNIK